MYIGRRLPREPDSQEALSRGFQVLIPPASSLSSFVISVNVVGADENDPRISYYSLRHLVAIAECRMIGTGEIDILSRLCSDNYMH